MTPTRYIVLEHDGQWKINLNNRYYGPLATRDEAVRHAIETARQAGALGYDACVMVMVGTTEFETVWQYRKDEEPRPE